MITPKQIKAARALMDWSQKVLAQKCDGVSEPTIKLIENEKINSTPGTLGIIRKTFEDNGVEFMSNHGVKMRSSEMHVLEGQAGFHEFYNDVYRTMMRTGSKEIVVSNVDEEEFDKWGGEELRDMHVARMSELDVRYRILVKEGDQHMPVSGMAEYKGLPVKLFGTVPFYLYGDKLAIILFTDTPKIFILHNSLIADGYKKQFNALWDMAQKS